jgi:hypothetical protein
MTLKRLSSRLTILNHWLGCIFLALFFYSATTLVLMAGRRYTRQVANPTEQLFTIIYMLALMAFMAWFTLRSHHVLCTKDSFLISRFGKQQTIAFKDVTAIELTFFGKWASGAWNHRKTAYFQYLGDDGKTHKIIFQVAQSVTKQPYWLKELQEILPEADSRRKS